MRGADDAGFGICQQDGGAIGRQNAQDQPRLDDVQDVFHNVKVSDEALAALEAA